MKYILLSVLLVAMLAGCILPEPDPEVPCPSELHSRTYLHDGRYMAYVLKGFRAENNNVVTCRTDGTYLYCEPFIYYDYYVEGIFTTIDGEVIPQGPNILEPQTFVAESLYCEEYVK